MPIFFFPLLLFMNTALAADVPADPAPEDADIVVMGGIDKPVIEEYVQRHFPQLRACAARQAKETKKELSGRIIPRFFINKSGHVTKIEITASNLGNKKIDDCVAGVFKRIIFPEVQGGGIVEVDYPLIYPLKPLKKK